MFAASKDTDIPFIFSEPQFTLGFEGNVLSGNGEKCIECRKESECDCRDCGAYNHTNACSSLATSFHGTPDYYMAATLGKAVIFDVDARGYFVEMPGRGLEPLRISPPDPKSGASANSATPANCDAHEGRFVGPFGQIALVSFLWFLRQIERCLRKSSPNLFSCRSLSA